MRALCKKISVAHDLDQEIQDELYGHMEDKLLAYLNGEEPVTEDDALILVREHFGDPAVLKNLLQDVHADNAHVSLAHRLATKEDKMRCLKLTGLCVGISLVVALLSILMETSTWFDIDAGSSWTAVWLVGLVISLALGVHSAYKGRFRFGTVLLSAIPVTLAVLLTLLVGFGLSRRGVPIPWREPVIEGNPFLLPFWLYFDNAVLIAIAFACTKMIRILLNRFFSSAEPRPASDVPSG